MDPKETELNRSLERTLHGISALCTAVLIESSMQEARQSVNPKQGVRAVLTTATEIVFKHARANLTFNN